MVKTAVEAAAPVVQAGVKATVDIAQPAIKAAAPTLEVRPRPGVGACWCWFISWLVWVQGLRLRPQT